MLKDISPRLYQQTIFAKASQKNTLVVLPTGMGKTAIAIMLSAHRLQQFPNSKVLMLSPTRPLVNQHLASFRSFLELPENQFAVFTGFVKPKTREKLWKEAKIIFSTPQGLENDIIAGRIKLEDVSLVVIDEAHRAVKEYSYVWIAKQYHAKARYPRILGLTASPGSDKESIQEIISTLFIEEIESRSHSDPDVQPYVQEIDVEWVKVALPDELMKVKKYFEMFLHTRYQELKEIGVLQKENLAYISKTDILSLQGQIQAKIAQGEKTPQLWRGISLVAEAMKVYHAMEITQTQGITTLCKYLDKLENEYTASTSKAIKRIFEDQHFKAALYLARELRDKNISHPKIGKLKEIIEKEIEENPKAKIIIFNQYRDNVVAVQRELSSLKNVIPKVFVGQAKKNDTGMSQKEQISLLEKFREGAFNVIIMTSVGEEGLDIPKVDLVIFYEPIPSAIRHIQRRGRTGRQEKGRVIILVAEKTIDENYRWSAHHKEKRMFRSLSTLKKDVQFAKPAKEKTLNDFEKKVVIIADVREKGSTVIKELLSLGAEIKLGQLPCADFIVSERAAIERKAVEDFVSSILDGRLLDQLKVLRYTFDRPLVIIEGEQDIFSVRNVHPNAIRGMLATITMSFGIPLIQTRNGKETAALIYLIAKREQEDDKKTFDPHASKKPMTPKEQQEYIVSSLPGIGPQLAPSLLKHFSTIQNIINASEQDLQKIEKIGKEKAKKIKDMVEREYGKE